LKLAANTWFAPELGLESAIKLVASLGFDAVEIAGTRENLKYEHSALKRMLSEQAINLACISAGVPFLRDTTHLNLHSSRLVTRKESVNYVFQCIDFASRFEAKLVYVCSFNLELGQTKVEARKVFAECLVECVDYAGKLGISLALEHFPSGLYPSILDTCGLVSEIAGLGLVFDTGHEVLCRKHIGLPIIDASKILDVHINNNDGISDNHWPPGKGVIRENNFREIVRHLSSIGYDKYLSLELANTGDDGSDLSESKTYLISLCSDRASN